MATNRNVEQRAVEEPGTSMPTLPTLHQNIATAVPSQTEIQSATQLLSGGKTVPCPEQNSSVIFVREALLSKLEWAGQELTASTSIEMSVQLCRLIKDLADALISVNRTGEM